MDTRPWLFYGMGSKNCRSCKLRTYMRVSSVYAYINYVHVRTCMYIFSDGLFFPCELVLFWSWKAM